MYLLLAYFVTIIILWKYIRHDFLIRKIKTRIAKSIFNFVRNNSFVLNFIPFFGSKIKKDLLELECAKKDIKNSCLEKRDLEFTFREIPFEGKSKKFILAEMTKIKTNSLSETYKISGAVYIDDAKHLELMKQVNNLTLYTNPLHDLWPQLKKQRAEIITMIKNKFGGITNPEVCGTITSGGTTSILAAVYAYRQFYNYSNPNLIMSCDAHPAYEKACNYFGIVPIIIQVDKESRKFDIQDIKRVITKNTICIITSAPSYPFGIIDDIPAISEFAHEFGCGCHVDACLGGGIIPWTNNIPVCDFTLKGITSISIDTHKYFYAPKGSSLILFKNKELRNYLTYVKMDWPGGFYVTPSFVGSSSGTNIAETWASIMYIGDEGYRKISEKILKIRDELVTRIKEIPEIRILGNPQLSVIGIVSNMVNMHSIYDVLTKKGWYFNALQNPTGIHFCITSTQTKIDNFVDIFIEDMKSAVEIVKKNNTNSKTQKLYCSTAEIPNFLFSALTEEIGEFHQFCDEQYTDMLDIKP